MAKPMAKYVLFALAIEGNYYGETDSTNKDLAEKLFISERHVRRLLAYLLRIGELQVLSREGGRGQPSRYLIVLKRRTTPSPLYERVKEDSGVPLSNGSTHARA